ncbi:MAG TPA: hypothetical protein VHH15_09835, partial [Actinophytocola sp.]|nr:hypothetical protein [Actinophytocola sp.]
MPRLRTFAPPERAGAWAVGSAIAGQPALAATVAAARARAGSPLPKTMRVRAGRGKSMRLTGPAAGGVVVQGAPSGRP